MVRKLVIIPITTIYNKLCEVVTAFCGKLVVCFISLSRMKYCTITHLSLIIVFDAFLRNESVISFAYLHGIW